MIRLALLLLLLCTSAPALAQCHGRFPFLTDICLSCIFPIRLANSASFSFGQEDTPNPGGSPLCRCGANIGFKVSFWEPARHADVTRTPWCLVSLGGAKVDLGFSPPRGSTARRPDGTQRAFYQAHWYVNPILYWLQLVPQFRCLESGEFDLVYLTEVDPTWNDDELSMILNPDAGLFGSTVAQGACAADCGAASAGFPLSPLFWCGGCQGSLYPLNGTIHDHQGGVASSSLITQRLAAKMHRELLLWSGAGRDGFCGLYPRLLMDKTEYKYSMTYPLPQTAENPLSRCCQPFGRSTSIWGAGREYPMAGEDFGYMVFRKRNCCVY